MEQHVARETSSVWGDSSGESPWHSLLTTKLNVPSVRTDLVTRPRLVRRLNEGTGGGLTLVSAPAGFGKTTLLADWVFRNEAPVGWLSLDEDDNDLVRFLSYLIAALQTVTSGTGEGAFSLLCSSQPPPTRALLTEMVNEASTIATDFALVLDDYHVLHEEDVHAALAFLAEHLPSQMRLIIASRTDPPLPLARRLAGRSLTKITGDDLRFTPQEASDFLGQVTGLDLSAGDVAALERRTEGWIAGLQLAAVSMRGRGDIRGFVEAFAGTDRHVFDYLAEEVFDRQGEDTRAFLLRTSILDRLNGPLCDAVTGQEDGQTTLEMLERTNLMLVPLDDRRRWYRYHHLFSGFLRERLLRGDPDLAPGLHRRASAWHEANGTTNEAIAHALKAGDFERVGAMIEVLAVPMTGRGETPALERMIENLPGEVLSSRPRLSIIYAALVLMPAGRLDAAEAWLRDAEQALRATGTLEASPNEEIERLIKLGGVFTSRALIADERGDVRGSIALNRRALETFPEERKSSIHGVAAVNLSEGLLDIGDLRAADEAIGEAIEIGRAADAPSIIASSLSLLGRLRVTQGRLSEAERAYSRVLRLTAKHGEVMLLDLGAARVGLGDLLLERDELEAATHNLLEGIELLRGWADPGGLPEGDEPHYQLQKLDDVEPGTIQAIIAGYGTLARVRQARGDEEGALAALAELDRLTENSNMSPSKRDRTETSTEAWRVRLWLAQGNSRRADRWARERGLNAAEDLDYSPESELEHVTLARLLIARGEYDEALGLLERLLEAAEAGGRGRTLIEVLVLRALVLRQRNDEQGALAALQRALILAEPEDYVRTFVSEVEPMTDLLRRLLRAWRNERPGDVPLEYVGKLLETLGAGITAPVGMDVRDQAGMILDPITGRELEVLRLLDSELSNREIAGRLFVSLDTVKSHTRHLYAKLGVHNRHQAVARARDLTLL